ncbi:MAG: ATP-dependent helicase C-terminal domain-containing protein [Bacteroidota bacterium]
MASLRPIDQDRDQDQARDSVPLPIDDTLPAVVDGLRARAAVVVEAPPGAGKTTRVPRALLDAGFADGGREIVVVQPRRLPARLAAGRVAEELREGVGETVGYTVRFEDVSGPRTRVRFVTEGILARRLLAEPELPGVSVVVLDEFHERHLATDVALALLRRLQGGRRPDLKLCVMSATLDAEPIAAYLGDCPRVRSEGRRFDVRVEHQDQPDDRWLAQQVTAAVRRLLQTEPSGDLLVFLPGAAEIRRCEEALADTARAANLLLLPLHGDLPLQAQARVVGPAAQRKVILSTNVAETSVTIDGVVAVVDSGLARIAAHSPWTGLPTLSLSKISQASAVQRAGRAGRTRPGVAVRLYTRHDFEGRRPHDTPEIARNDLAETMLTLGGLGIRDVAAFDWLTPPPAAAVEAARVLLGRLGAVDRAGSPTDRGKRMLRFPLHPRLARVLVEAEDRGVAADGAAVVALIGERDVRARERHRPDGGGPRDRGHAANGVDIIALFELFELARAAGFSRDRLHALGLDSRATAVAEQARRQLAGMARSRSGRPSAAGPGASRDRKAQDRELCRATLAGFPDRVARRRQGESGATRTVVLAAGGTAELGYEADSEFLLAIDAEERNPGRPGAPGGAGANSRGSGTVVRLGCGIDPDWLGDLDGDQLRATDAVEFDQATERVVQRSRLTFGALVLEESVRPAEPSALVSGVLAEAALARGAAAFDEPGALSTLSARLAILRPAGEAAGADNAAAPLDDATLRQAIVGACEGLRGFAELRQQGLASRIAAGLPAAVRARLEREAPLAVTLPGGRSVRVNYSDDQPPWIESRLQDFFGMARGPVVAGGRLPLTLHLLAPNGRAVQVTRDLDSFWRQHYPAIRRELGRRYPRHAWPEDGSTASPPPPQSPHRRR